MCEQIEENGKMFNNNNEVKWLKFPYKISKVDPKINQELLEDFKGERTGFVQVGPKKWFLPSGYEKEAENYYNFQVRPDDIWIVTFPRSGTTWAQEMIWLLANNLNYEEAANVPLWERFPFLEFSIFMNPEIKQEFIKENSYSQTKLDDIEKVSYPVRKYLDGLNERRFIKTHLSFDLLPPNLLEVGCKVIYIARNPKDVAVSYYHLNRLFRTQGYNGDFAKHWNYFERNLQSWTPYWSHIEEGWQKRHEKNLLFLFYEDMNKNLLKAIGKVSNFLDQQYSNEQLERLENHLKIENFRNNKSVNFDILKQLGILLSNEQCFIRNGKTGGWRDYFTGELNERANKWIEDNLKLTDLRFPEY